MEVLAKLVSEGAEVRLIHAKEPGPRFRKDFDRYPELVESDLFERVLCPRMHMKVIIGDGAWAYVGEWYTAGSNTCVYSYPRKQGELGKTQHEIVTSNRRWREEEFLVPRHLTEGVKQLAIKLQHVPDTRPLFPGHPFPAESAWSEARYWAYCYRMPKVTLPGDRPAP